jgi:hypothetical protein
MNQVNFGSIGRQELRNTSIKGINFYAHLIHASTATAFTTGALLWEGVNLKT